MNLTTPFMEETKMTNKTKQTSKTLEFIKLGNQVSLSFNTSVKPNELREALNTFGQYNRFNPDKITDVIMKHKDFISRIEVGLEGSVVIYITFASWSNQLWAKESVWGKSESLDKLDKLASQKLLLREMLDNHCDELSSTSLDGKEFKTTWYQYNNINSIGKLIYRLRLWWD